MKTKYKNLLSKLALFGFAIELIATGMFLVNTFKTSKAYFGF